MKKSTVVQKINELEKLGFCSKEINTNGALTLNRGAYRYEVNPITLRICIFSTKDGSIVSVDAKKEDLNLKKDSIETISEISKIIDGF